jgi:hypothetical protein
MARRRAIEKAMEEEGEVEMTGEWLSCVLRKSSNSEQMHPRLRNRRARKRQRTRWRLTKLHDHFKWQHKRSMAYENGFALGVGGFALRDTHPGHLQLR